MQRILTTAAILLIGVGLNAQTLPIYNTIPTALPPSLVSRSFEGTFTSEFGNLVEFDGANRHLTSVSVAMVTWAYFSKYPGSPNPSGWTHDITLNLYSVNNSDPNHPGGLIGSVTQSFFIPWRPEPSPECGGTLWLAPDGSCNNGMAFEIAFDFSSLSLTLPNRIIFGIAYNTQSEGQHPTGVFGPFNDLNVGLNLTNTGVPCAISCQVGSNPLAPQYFVNTIDQNYADGGAGGSRVFRLNVGGNLADVAIEFNASAPPPAFITVTGGKTQSAMVGTPFGNALQVKVTAADGEALPGVAVTFSVPVSGASATLSVPSVITDHSGVAGVTATANAIAGAYVVTASVTGVTPAIFSLTNLAGPAQAIAFVQQPTSTQAGSTITPPVSVSLKDALGNPATGATVTLGIQGGGATLHGTTTQTVDPGGIATFSDLNITTASAGYVLIATGGSLATTSSPFNITAGSPASIAVLAGNLQTAFVGTAFAAPLAVTVHDANNNPVPGVTVTFGAPASGASVTFASLATATTDANGIAISPALTANSQTGSPGISATIPGVAAAAAFTLFEVDTTANKLAFLQQPTDTTAGAAISPAVTVQLQDSSGNALHTMGIPITLDLFPGQTLSGTTTQSTDPNGLARFADLSVQHAGRYEVLARAASIVSALSQTWNIAAGVPTRITGSGGTPQGAIIHTAFGEPLQATVTDGAGNPENGVAVTFTAPTSGPGGQFSGQSTVTVGTDAQGHASAMITANGFVGSYVATASAAAITGSAAFSLTNLPVGSSALAFVQQPTNTAAGQVINPPVSVRVQDASGQPVSVEGLPIVLSLSSGAGALLGTLVQLTNAMGLATFNDLSIAETGTKRLRATANQEIPADSNAFQITSGPAAGIAAIGGGLQSATVLQQFPLPLQVQVKDSAGNPVSGVTVTFAAPSSGPGGTFAGPITVTTDSNGVATSPALTANSQAGSFTVTAAATGIASPAVFALTNLPQQTSTIRVNPNTLAFASEINQPAPSGQTVQIAALVSWSASSSASWLSAAPGSGSGPGSITVSVNPAGLAVGVYTGSVRITGSDGSAAVVFVTYTIAGKPVLLITPHTLVFTTTSNTITPAVQTLTATSSSRAIAYGISARVSTPTGGNWLQVSTTQGQTAGTVTVTANPAGLASGVYDGSVLFTPAESGINPVAVPVTLIVDCSQGGCQLQPAILSVVNGASFQPGGAPRAILTIFGTNLSDAAYQATSYPLPTQLGPTSVMVNGALVPLFYASPAQINFQMPGGAPIDTVQIVVNNSAVAGGARALHASPPHSSPLTAVDTGLFVTSDKRAAALNVDLSPHTAATPVPAGGYIILFITGAGAISPPLPDGTAAPVSPLSLINAPVQVTIGGQPAQVTYQGVAPGFAGLEQLNVIVPAGLTPGDQPTFVTINGRPSNAAVITTK